MGQGETESFSVKYLPGLGNVNWHRSCCGDETTDHTGNKVAKQAVLDVTCLQSRN